MLIIFGGLPASGKTTLSRALAERLAAVHLRVDTIEHVLMAAGATGDEIGPTGYHIAGALALDNLRIGHVVIVDSVNPWPLTRQGWRDVAARAGVVAVEVETVCSDRAEHRRRVETRPIDIEGFTAPTWHEVEGRDYRPWPEAHLVVETAGRAVEACLADLLAYLGDRAVRPA
jgi:predicted kinase